MALYLFISACLAAFVSCTMIFRIIMVLLDEGIDVQFLNIRWNMIQYLGQYKRITYEKHGKVGFAYYLVNIFFYLSLLLFITSIVFKLTDIN
jgi:hypothetical protein